MMLLLAGKRHLSGTLGKKFHPMYCPACNMFRAVIATFVISSGFLQVMKKHAFILGLLISELMNQLEITKV